MKQTGWHNHRSSSGTDDSAESEKQYQVVGLQLIMKKKHHRVPVRQAVVADLSPDGRGRMGQNYWGKMGSNHKWEWMGIMSWNWMGKMEPNIMGTDE